MDAKRAREIAASPVMADVIFDGAPIYIENVLDDNMTAMVHTLDKPSNRRKVSISNLIEQ